VSGTTVTVSGSGTDTAGSISSWRVVLNGPSAVNDTAAGSGASFAKSYTNLANGYYTGSVTATDSGTGLTSNACGIAQFLVGTPPALQPPAGLAVSAATSNSVTLTWNAAGGATGYNVYRNGSRVNAVTGTSYTDAGLAASTTYSYQVSSTNGGGESALSAAVAATTASGWTCSATTSTNYAHVQAGRAHDSGGYALANGSNQNMGLDNTFYTSTLAQTAPGYYVIGSCP
jgi:poly(3-hydroxybutyrate) depolymerase